MTYEITGRTVLVSSSRFPYESHYETLYGLEMTPEEFRKYHESTLKMLRDKKIERNPNASDGVNNPFE